MPFGPCRSREQHARHAPALPEPSRYGQIEHPLQLLPQGASFIVPFAPGQIDRPFIHFVQVIRRSKIFFLFFWTLPFAQQPYQHPERQYYRPDYSEAPGNRESPKAIAILADK